jgi:transitional endoplasmic reticulum ATPase
MQHVLDAMTRVGAASLRGNALTAMKQLDQMDGMAAEQESALPSPPATASTPQLRDFAPEIGGLEDVKARLQQSIEWPIKYRDTYKRLGLRAPRGLLMHGPPGGGKTSIARALCRSIKASFFAMDAASVYSSLLGEAERYIRDTFTKARGNAPCVVFIDELDTLVQNREDNSGNGGNDVSSRVLSTLLNEMDGVENCEGVLIVAATNRLDKIDAALLRPGRFDHIVLVPPPDEAGCAAILRAQCKKMPLAVDVDLGSLGSRAHALMSRTTEGVSGAKICNLAREAAMRALRRTTLEYKDASAESEVQIKEVDFADCLDSLELSTVQEKLLFSANTHTYE